MIPFERAVDYTKDSFVVLHRVSLGTARHMFECNRDIYIVKDFTEFDKNKNLRLFFSANRKQGIKDFDMVCKVYRSANKITKSKRLFYFIIV